MMNPLKSHVQMQILQPQMNHGYENWSTPWKFTNQNPNSMTVKPPHLGFKWSQVSRIWPKGRKPHGKGRTEIRRSLTEKHMKLNVYNPLPVNELQHQDKFKGRKPLNARKLINKRYRTKSTIGGLAPRNTTSFIMRSKKNGGLAPPSVSPCPETPAILRTPVLSPLPEMLSDMGKEQWGVDAYGTMTGLIRLRSSSSSSSPRGRLEDENVGSSSQRDMEVERRLDQDVSRFEMIYTPRNRFVRKGSEFEIEELEEENLMLKERVGAMEKELNDLKRRIDGFGKMKV